MIAFLPGFCWQAYMLTYTGGKGVGEIAAEERALRAALQQVLNAVVVNSVLELGVKLPGAGAVRLDEGLVHVFTPDYLLPLLPAT